MLVDFDLREPKWMSGSINILLDRVLINCLEFHVQFTLDGHSYPL